MKILVYGAGVLGSTLAHGLLRGGNEVTLLARGERLREFETQGLVIRHYAQLKTTTDSIQLTETLNPTDSYDVVFVVMQRQQLDSVLPVISACQASRRFVLLGNNVTAKETHDTIQLHSAAPKQIIFGFQNSGGRRENGRVISVHSGLFTTSGKMTLGSLSDDVSYQPVLRQAFEQTHYQLNFSAHMDAWLKYHVAFILPICFAVYHAGGDLRRVSGNNQLINQVIDAAVEAYSVVEANGYPVEPPEDQHYFEKNRRKLFWMLKVMAATPIGRLTASDHAMAARAEMERLYQDFCILKNRTNLETPVWDGLSRCMQMPLE